MRLIRARTTAFRCRFAVLQICRITTTATAISSRSTTAAATASAVLSIQYTFAHPSHQRTKRGLNVYVCFCTRFKEFDLCISYHITTSLHHHIITSPHHYITTSLHHHINTTHNHSGSVYDQWISGSVGLTDTSRQSGQSKHTVFVCERLSALRVHHFLLFEIALISY